MILPKNPRRRFSLVGARPELIAEAKRKFGPRVLTCANCSGPFIVGFHHRPGHTYYCSQKCNAQGSSLRRLHRQQQQKDKP